MKAAMLIALSVVLSTGRNLFSKNIAGVRFGTKRFFAVQATIFGVGGGLLLLQSRLEILDVAGSTCIYAVVYGVMLVAAQWCYTVALSRGKVAICSTIYSMGFIIPTLYSATMTGEKLGFCKLIGIALVSISIVLYNSNGQEKTRSNNGVSPIVIIAMCASGLLGVLQKIQQTSPWAYQKDEFVCMGFIVAALISIIASAVLHGSDCNREEYDIGKSWLYAVGTGACFSGANTLNTTLAGMISGAVLFPILNIGSILVSMLMAAVLLRERLTKKEGLVTLISILAIVWLNI